MTFSEIKNKEFWQVGKWTNGQVSDWSDVKAGPLLFLIYFTDLSEGLSSNAKPFADDTSLLSVIHDSNNSALEQTNDLGKINRWDYQRKTSFNPDPKHAQGVIFTRKSKAISHPPLVFNNNNVIQAISPKHFGIILDSIMLDCLLKII